MRLSLAILLLVVSAQAQVRYHFGSDPKWAEPGFDDSAWPTVTADFPLPSPNSDGMVWFRFRVPVPPDRSSLAIFLDRSGGACSPGEFWVNGVRVGSQGRFPPDPLTTDHCGSGVFDLRDGIVEPGGTAVVALRSWISPLLRGALFFHPPVLPRPEMGSSGFMRAREKNAFDGGALSFLVDGFLVLLELGIGFGVLFIWWRARAGASLLWFSLFVLSWGALEVAWFWPPSRNNLQSSELYWFWQCAFSVVINTAVFEFMGQVFDVPRWATRTLEVAGIAWPILWFPAAFLVEPSPAVTALGSFGGILFGFQSVGQTALALWAAAKGRKETRGLAVALFFAGAVYLLSDYLTVLPRSVRIADMAVSTDNTATVFVMIAMCYLLLRRLWQESLRKEELDAEFEAAREMSGFGNLRQVGVPVLSGFLNFRRLAPYASGLVYFSVAYLLYLLRTMVRDGAEKQRLESEMQAARSVQQFLVPAAPPSSADYSIDAVYEPAREVGGDLHWSRVEPDGAVCIVVGDVSGKGLGAAMLVSVVVGALDAEETGQPAMILRKLNTVVHKHSRGGFVTACCVRVEPDGRVSVASAGHPAPYGPAGEIAVEVGLPLGIVPDTAYAALPFTLARGEALTIVTDGVIEAENAQRELFGFDRTREISGKSAQQIADAAKAWGQNDDITVVTVRRSVLTDRRDETVGGMKQ